MEARASASIATGFREVLPRIRAARRGHRRAGPADCGQDQQQASQVPRLQNPHRGLAKRLRFWRNYRLIERCTWRLNVEVLAIAVVMTKILEKSVDSLKIETAEICEHPWAFRRLYQVRNELHCRSRKCVELPHLLHDPLSLRFTKNTRAGRGIQMGAALRPWTAKPVEQPPPLV